MSEVVNSWTLFDRIFFVVLLFTFFSIPMLLAGVDRKLDRIIRLLELGNDNRR